MRLPTTPSDALPGRGKLGSRLELSSCGCEACMRPKSATHAIRWRLLRISPDHAAATMRSSTALPLGLRGSRPSLLWDPANSLATTFAANVHFWAVMGSTRSAGGFPCAPSVAHILSPDVYDFELITKTGVVHTVDSPSDISNEVRAAISVGCSIKAMVPCTRGGQMCSSR